MKLHFQTYGHGLPLIILHGLFGTLDNWHSMSKRLGECFHVYALDLRNHGRSPHSDEFDYGVMCDDLSEFMNDHAVQSSYILGHSMGGKLGMEFALSNPDKVERLAAVDLAPRAYPPVHDRIFNALDRVDFAIHKTRSDVEEVLAAEIQSDAVRQFLMKNLRRKGDSGLEWKMNLGVIRARYGEINKALVGGRTFAKPVLVVRSLKSDYIRDEDLPLIEQLFPNVQVAGIDAGHWIHAEAPDVFFEIVRNFFTG